MNIMNRINNEQALDAALVYSGIENVEHRCLKNSYEAETLLMVKK